MASSNSKENGKADVFGHSRKTMQFNERTDRSLHVELSQLERNRREIMRDLRKIKQIKTALNDQLRSALEHKAINRSRSDTSIYATSSAEPGLKLPIVETKAGRPRFHSDVGPVDKLVTNEKIRLEKLGRRVVERNPDRTDEPGSIRSRHNQIREDIQGTSEESTADGYKTNQELREELLIKSRFNQLGSKYVGKEIFDARHLRTSAKGKRRDAKAGRLTLSRNDLPLTIEHQKKVTSIENETIQEETKDELSPEFSGLSVNEAWNIDQEIDHEGGDSLRNKQNLMPLQTEVDVRKGKEHVVPVKLSPISARKMNGSFVPQRRISSHSSGGPDMDSARARQDSLLPTIPLELRSQRQSKELNSLERAFMVCRQVSAKSKDLKNERKRRFANLIDMVVKQKKVVNAWEPLMRNVGDIQSDDDV